MEARFHWVFGGSEGAPLSVLRAGGTEVVTESEGLRLVATATVGNIVLVELCHQQNHWCE